MSVRDGVVTAEIGARRRVSVTTALVVLVVLLVLISLGIGPVRLSPLAVIEALFGGGSDVSQVIVREIRLPRTILGVAIGARKLVASRRRRRLAAVVMEDMVQTSE